LSSDDLIIAARIGIRAIATMGNKKPLHRMARGFVFPARIRHARVPGNDMPANLARINLFSCDRHIDLLGMNGLQKRAASFCPDGIGVKIGFVFLQHKTKFVATKQQDHKFAPHPIRNLPVNCYSA
jgi:hypothetical protein